jgi:hypothetical protein
MAIGDWIADIGIQPQRRWPKQVLRHPAAQRN